MTLVAPDCYGWHAMRRVRNGTGLHLHRSSHCFQRDTALHGATSLTAGRNPGDHVTNVCALCVPYSNKDAIAVGTELVSPVWQLPLHCQRSLELPARIWCKLSHAQNMSAAHCSLVRWPVPPQSRAALSARGMQHPAADPPPALPAYHARGTAGALRCLQPSGRSGPRISSSRGLPEA